LFVRRPASDVLHPTWPHSPTGFRNGDAVDLLAVVAPEFERDAGRRRGDQHRAVKRVVAELRLGERALRELVNPGSTEAVREIRDAADLEALVVVVVARQDGVSAP